MASWVARLVDLLAKMTRLHADIQTLTRNVDKLATLTNDLDRRLLVVETTLALEARAAKAKKPRRRDN